MPRRGRRPRGQGHPLRRPARRGRPGGARSGLLAGRCRRAPALISELADVLGSQAVVVAIDAAGGEVRARAGTAPTGRAAVAWASEAEECGAGEILLTSIDADGTRTGYDLELTAAVAEAVSVPVIASGGGGEAAHVAEVLEVAQAALLASILHEQPARLATLRAELRGLGVALRDAA